MSRCFVIQPFDSGKFDKRYKETFAPAIKAAGLDPYRVDEDTRVDVLINSIEEGIRSAAVCLADITTDNPNVWFELGFAFAANRPVTMVCSDERRDKYPFDIQHRVVSSYKTEAQSDFELLSQTITARLKAAANRGQVLEQMAESEPVAAISGISSIEVVVLAVAAGTASGPDEAFNFWELRNDAEKAGLTRVAISLALRRLQRRNLLEDALIEDIHGDVSKAARITSQGWDWIDANEELFSMRRGLDGKQDLASDDISDDELPF